jgi:hypothetical protein
MGLCHGKLPGEWYGPHAISTMLKVLKSFIYNYIGVKQIV